MRRKVFSKLLFGNCAVNSTYCCCYLPKVEGLLLEKMLKTKAHFLMALGARKAVVNPVPKAGKAVTVVQSRQSVSFIPLTFTAMLFLLLLYHDGDISDSPDFHV